jgi:type IV pilus assembly protein PilV
MLIDPSTPTVRAERSSAKSKHERPTQRGSILLEALIAILLFSMGMLALAGVQAAAIKNAADAKHRAEASFLANQIIAQMWAENPATLGSYQHNPTTNARCNFAGGASGNAKVAAWLGNAASPAAGTVAGNLPRAAANMQQITVGANNVVTVTICWQNPSDPLPRSYVGVAQING